MKEITIVEEFQISGTDVFLEKGDKIVSLKEDFTTVDLPTAKGILASASIQTVVASITGNSYFQSVEVSVVYRSMSANSITLQGHGLLLSIEGSQILSIQDSMYNGRLRLLRILFRSSKTAMVEIYYS